MGYFVYALFAAVVVVDILYAYYGWVRLPPLQSLFVRGWLAAVALLAVMSIAAVMSRRVELSSTSIAYAMAVAALIGLVLLAGPLLTPWQERRPVVIAMNILSSLTSLVTILWGLFIYLISHIGGITNYLGVVLGLALSVPLVILTPICMVASTRLASQGRRYAIYVAFIPVALAALVNVAISLLPISAPGWQWHPATGRWT